MLQILMMITLIRSLRVFDFIFLLHFAVNYSPFSRGEFLTAKHAKHTFP